MANETLAAKIAERLDHGGFLGGDPEDTVMTRDEVQEVLDAEPLRAWYCRKCGFTTQAKYAHRPLEGAQRSHDANMEKCRGTLKPLKEVG